MHQEFSSSAWNKDSRIDPYALTRETNPTQDVLQGKPRHPTLDVLRQFRRTDGMLQEKQGFFLGKDASAGTQGQDGFSEGFPDMEAGAGVVDGCGVRGVYRVKSGGFSGLGRGRDNVPGAAGRGFKMWHGTPFERAAGTPSTQALAAWAAAGGTRNDKHGNRTHLLLPHWKSHSSSSHVAAAPGEFIGRMDP